MRIRIMGGSGSGKSTLAMTLGKHLKISCIIHLDDMFWLSGWKMKEFAILKREVLDRIKHEENWVIDGNYSKIGFGLGNPTHIVIIYLPIYRNLWQLLIREVGRRSRLKFKSVTRAPLNVVNEPHEEHIIEGFRILGGQAVEFYRFKARKNYKIIKQQMPETPIFVYRGTKDFKELIRFVSMEGN
jgi:hypothetical protein